MPEAARTLVKSPPELWAEVSDPDALTRHLGAFGEIRITRLEPEATVAWEGDRVRGTVDLSPAGWGTKVRVTAEDTEAPAPPPEAAAPAEPEPEPEPEEPRRPGFIALLVRLLGRDAVAEPEPARPAEPAADPQAEPAPAPAVDPELLDGVLASLGSAHHRPFSRG